MSKIGRRPINIQDAQVEIKGNEIHYKGKLVTGVHQLDRLLTAELKGKELYLTPKKVTQDTNRIWGLHRALLANKIKGAQSEFEKKLIINGLGFKAALTGSKMQFSLGFSHKINFDLPAQVRVEIDKSGQIMVFKSAYKDLLGQVCSDIRAMRPPEPYKATGIKYETEVIIRKAGKAKS